MTKRAKPPAPPVPPAGDELPSETVRLAGDLVDMLREIAFNTRDARNKRMKLTQLADGLFRPVVERAYREFKSRQSKAKE